MRCDIMVVRDASAGVPAYIARHVKDHVSILNAGESDVSHPTQGLLDILTIRRHKGSFDKLVVAIVGGSKVSTKLTVLDVLADKVDTLIVCGGIANTFIAAEGHGVGKSLYEADMLDTARKLAADTQDRAEIPVPDDVVCGSEFSADAVATTRSVDAVADDEMILDIGPQTARRFAAILENAGTIIWNGPVGVFEFDQFGEGTRILAEAIAASPAFSVAGGGDTLAAIDKYGVRDGISYISTGGGAFLEFVEGKKLPAVEMLERRGQ